MVPPAHAEQPTKPTGHLVTSALAPLRWSLDRVLAVGYGVLYDSIVERFAPCKALQGEVLALVEQSAPDPTTRRNLKLLDVGCGPGTFAVTVASAGFSVVGLDSYTGLLDLAREKRTAKRLPNLAFAHADLADDHDFGADVFDHVVSIHSLYLHESPEAVLRGAYHVLKPGGYAIFVNPTRRIRAWTEFRESWRAEGLGAALGRLLWLVPHGLFETMRKPVGPHYWPEAEFASRVSAAGFSVLATRRTFLDGASVLVWAQKPRVAR
jgi:SAM-dependent methyltransferase